MAILESKQQRAALIILVLGILLTLALWPFLTGLIGAPVLYVMFAPLYRLLARRMPPGAAAGIVIVLGILLILGPGISFVTLLATEAQQMAGGVLRSPTLARLSELQVGPYNIGERLEDFGSRVATWIADSALGVVGAATRVGIQLTIAFFGLYYLLGSSNYAWRGVRPFIPFSRDNSDKLRQRFKDVTVSTLIGTFATAVLQGVLVGVGFWATGLANALFWGVVTVILAILPIVGSGLVWAPGAVALALDQRYLLAIGLALWGVLIVGQVDNLVRPYVFRRYAQIHPFITIIGAFAGIRYFGLLGLVIGPLAISYFFELIRMYREEYLDEDPTGEVVITQQPKHQAMTGAVRGGT
jgi:predicted PurR-regulated permease PerM